jgi:hypothetical protein
VLLGAHIHHIEVMAPESVTVSGLDTVQVIMPSISPVFGNNPGYGLLTLNSDQTIDDLKFKFF